MQRRQILRMAGLTALAATTLGQAASPPQRPDRPSGRSDSALVLIEFQNEWLDTEAPLNRLLQDRTQLEHAVQHGRQLLQRARTLGVPVVHAGLDLVTDPDYLLFDGGQDKRGLKGAIPRAGTWSRRERVAFARGFEPEPGEFVVRGRSGASVLLNSTLDPFLRNRGIRHLYLTGFALHVCVESTLRHAHDLGYEVTVVNDAAPAFTAAQRRHVLEHVVHHFGDQVSTRALLDQWTTADA